ncbi:hypothetical protein D088_690067 [Salmonella enterica subsp. houtenae serovar 16:z4,z32:-- str. RKS3027]|nr:hypothetical protein D088_690067 [Salmonella enterica subsp. houtenae serovar 16:z4,z32:-- str. RKS3027]
MSRYFSATIFEASLLGGVLKQHGKLQEGKLRIKSLTG